MKEKKTFVVDTLFILSLFILFTISALMLVSVGVEVYKQTAEKMNDNSDIRTSVSYITEKIRQSDTLLTSEDLSSSSAVSISHLSTQTALKLTQEIDGQYYDTYLYLYDGFLKELLIKDGTDLGEQVLMAGRDILKLKAFEIEQVSPNLFSIELTTTDNQTQTLFVSTHCKADTKN